MRTIENVGDVGHLVRQFGQGAGTEARAIIVTRSSSFIEGRGGKYENPGSNWATGSVNIEQERQAGPQHTD